ncbi:MAG: AmmeMemoRadiSam system protein A [Bacteroidetes bacterium]|jgi:uncharacterized protein|nr:AmmeMemoRadiSam system protein A [Bacteroidota bacterium]MBT6687875.1 AmmeMemoRadiSam system protein A [Bacteroidota bacterium]MBT7142477.1 AmmeMemoRadiSam system protein A [Bacteroidota bacterium]MBT7490016.1 AmmeMemoRadiSam system protein A [Bacteroidota bacterium]
MMYEPKTIYSKLALETILTSVKKRNLKLFRQQKIPELLSKKQACFVSIHKKDGSLRGCIGTIEPVRTCLFHEIIDNAIAASSRDSRFSPITADELDSIEVSVDVLSIPEIVNDISELDPQNFGVIVSDNSYRKAVLLPNLEGIETVKYQLDIVKRKAGIYDNYENLNIQKFTATRYH